MDIKKLTIALLIACALILSVSAISAADNENVDLIKDSNPTAVPTNTTSTDSTAKTVNTTKTTTQTTKVKVTADYTVKEYKKKGTFKITVKDSNKKPLNKVTLKVKVYTGKKAKTYTVKTKSNGIATLSTKNLKLGNHKVEITSGDSKYNINKKSTIFIGKKKVTTLKLNQQKNFKNGDYFRFFKETTNGQYGKGVYVENLRIYKGNLMGANSHHIIKVKYTFKNAKTGKTITKTSVSEYMCKVNLIKGYNPIKAKVYYIQ